MHYGDMYFASGSAETMTIIESNKERYQKLMGTQTQLSPNDVVTLNTMYKCYSDGMDVKCAHGGVKKANGDCFCVEPFTGSNCEDVDPALGVIVEVEGESFVESPNFPSNYPVNQKTFIVLQCPAGKRVSIKFLTFEVEQYGTGCGYDWLDIRVGPGDIYGNKFCGKDLQDATLESEDNYIVFKFVTNGAWEYEGFEDEVTCI
ncbi:protein SpAN-like [Asterias rubens]|uniref:protein SpAN-like n=1 Tax=Asterias rubens TaxID=7604 RepID=UPI00145541F5|nr:protein SpAN-like [Asterias rubens]